MSRSTISNDIGVNDECFLDIQECIEDPGVCGVGVCINDDGGFHCICPDGYMLHPSGSKLQSKIHIISVYLVNKNELF